MTIKTTLALTLFSLSFSTFAAISEYNAPEILARANIGDGYNLPPMSFLSNTSPVINNRGDVSFKLMAFNGENTQGLWLKRGIDESGKIVYSTDETKFVTDPSLNDAGVIAFNTYDDFASDGIFTFNGDSSEVKQVLKPANEDIAFYTYPQVLTNGKVYFRGTDQENARTYFQYDGSLKPIIAEGASSYGQKSSYLFKPYLNDSGAMAFKRRIGDVGQWDESNGDEILMLKPNGSSLEPVVIARDKDMDPNSVFRGFTNSASISKNNMVAFTAVLEDGTKALIRYKEGHLKNVVIEKSDGISEIEMFSPKINEQGQILFRAKDMDGKRGIYLADSKEVKKIVAEGDEVMTDLGMGKILSNPNFPGFGGDVDMNDHGEIVFYCLVVGAKDNKEWGSAVYKVSPKL
ncbi:hypothetical protein DOM21_10660 [Bacteriovorax stolpii]|uniref:Uncharacterized protein n=1 Tax=Bacteriovorax stolpii TaxID=960 RepID=A0A2K9NRJ4_BACTC|nr:hypothetical protein [Bacteriovorax stolpii]AUN98121.1 hypothetical protein C0V70_08365 [Bacteriovorax stolpii]QDK41899.1 hypothetical protein DOM21_10660 [Bacteriovorax stolpii]TDP52034.1 hypothetical protein C8D79_2682 [Bacteriovorax stolpii]